MPTVSRRTLFRAVALPLAPLQTTGEPEEWQSLGDPLVSVLRKLKNKLVDPATAPALIFGARERVTGEAEG